MGSFRGSDWINSRRREYSMFGNRVLEKVQTLGQPRLACELTKTLVLDSVPKADPLVVGQSLGPEFADVIA